MKVNSTNCYFQQTGLVLVFILIFNNLYAKNNFNSGNNKHGKKFYDVTDTINVQDFGAQGDGSTYEDAAILKAFKYANSIGGAVIVFPKGVYRINASEQTIGEDEFVFELPGNSTIIAYDAEFTGRNTFCFRADRNNLDWYGGKITLGRLVFQASHVHVKDVRIEYSWAHSFHLSGSKSNDPTIVHRWYSDITILNCISYRSARTGFSIHRGDYPFVPGKDSIYLGNFDHLRFTNCTTIEPSYVDGVNFSTPYDFGFGIENALTAQDVIFDNCHISKAPSMGFHVENRVPTKDIILLNCTADSCGQNPDGYPYGFMYKDGFTLINCWGTGNRRSTFAHVAAYKSHYSIVNCGTTGYKAFNFTTSDSNNPNASDNQYIFDPATHGEFACNLAYVQGSPLLPMKALDFDNIFDYATTTINGATVPYIYNKDIVFSSANRETSIGSQPIWVDLNTQYTISVTAKELSGSSGNIYMYVQEYDSMAALIKHPRNFMFKTPLQSIGTSKFTTVKLNVGKGANVPNRSDLDFTTSNDNFEFDPDTRWVRVTLVLAEKGDDDKHYAISDFRITPNGNASTSRTATNSNVMAEQDVNMLSLPKLQSVYPNPFTGNSFTLNLDKPVGAREYYSLIDFRGNLVQRGLLTSQTQTIETYNLPRGIYILKLSNGKSMKIEKL